MEIIFICYEGVERPSSRVRGYRFAEELQRRGFGTKVISFADRFHMTGETPYLIPDIKKLYYNSIILRELLAYPNAIFYVQKYGYHVLAPFLARRIHGNRLIMDYDDWDLHVQPFRCFRLFGLRNIRSMTRFVFNKSDAVVTASHALLELGNQLLKDNNHLYLIPTGVDTDRFHPNEAGVEKDCVTFGWLGLIWNDEMFENIAFLLKAFASIQSNEPRKLIISGQYYHFRERLESLAQALGIGELVSFPGWIPPDKVPEFLREIDVGLFILTKDSAYNQAKSPTKLFEYMASGAPAIAGFYGEALRVVSDGVTGFTATDEASYITAMSRLASNQALRKRMGSAARSVALERYSLKTIGAQLEQVLCQLNERGSKECD